jgi:hypothetical protein
MATQFQTIKSVFNGGEMSPLMDGRTDSEKYATGCRLLENFIVRPYGGIFKRPGTRYGTSGVSVDDTIRLIPFRRSTDVNFVLGFAENAILVWSYSVGSFTLVDTLPTTYQAEDIRDIHYCQINDVMFLTHGGYQPQRVTRANDGTWSIEDVPFQFAPALDPPDDAVTMKIVYDESNWVSGTTYGVSSFVLYQNELYRCKTANSDVSFTAAKWDKATYLSPWSVGNSYVAGNVVEYFGSNYFCYTAHTSSSANNPAISAANWQIINIQDYRLIASSATFDADEVGSTWLLSPGSGNVGRFAFEKFGAASTTTTTAAIFIQGGYLVRTNWGAGSAPSLSTVQLQESLDRINFTVIREWRIQGINEGTISYTSEAPNTGGWYRLVAIRDAGGSAAAADDTMTIEPTVGKLDIPFKIESYTSTTVVKGIPRLAVDSLIPNEVINIDFPVWRKGAFSASRGYPRTVCFHDQRLWFAGTETEPMRIWGSQTDDFYTFLTGTLETSGIDVTLAATQANDIEWITSFKRTMVIGTTGEEWTMDSGEQDAALSPSNLRLRRWSRYGSTHIQPLLAGDALLWLTRDFRLREFAYVFEKDGYSAPDMSLLAEHIPAHIGRVVEMTYTQSPDPIVWFTFEGGEFAGFSYDRENNVTAWHRHNFGHKDRDCESVCTIYSTDAGGSASPGDTLIFLMEKNGAFSLESIHGGQMLAALGSSDPTYNSTTGNLGPGTFCDSWQLLTGSYNAGTGNTTFAVGSHLNGCSVVFTLYPDGDVILNDDGSPKEVTVSGGNAVIAGDYSDLYIVGVAFSAFAMPNRIEIQTQQGTAQVSKWRIVRVALRLFQSLYGNIVNKPTISGDYLIADWSDTTAIDYADMDEFQRSSFVLWSYDTDSIFVKTGQTKTQPVMFDWVDAADITLTSRHPYPFNVTALLLDVQSGDVSGAP